MLIWINGAFGVGKTSVARELAARWPAALLFDPEQVGFLLRRLVPPEERGKDFQDLPLWRSLVVATAAGLLETYQRPLIVPMTLVDRRYFDEVVGELRRGGLEVHHFALLASRATLRRRLLLRWSLPTSKLWALRQIDRCTEALARPELALHLDTDRRSVPEVVEAILAALPEPTGPFRLPHLSG